MTNRLILKLVTDRRVRPHETAVKVQGNYIRLIFNKLSVDRQINFEMHNLFGDVQSKVVAKSFKGDYAMFTFKKATPAKWPQLYARDTASRDTAQGGDEAVVQEFGIVRNYRKELKKFNSRRRKTKKPTQTDSAKRDPPVNESGGHDQKKADTPAEPDREQPGEGTEAEPKKPWKRLGSKRARDRSKTPAPDSTGLPCPGGRPGASRLRQAVAGDSDGSRKKLRCSGTQNSKRREFRMKSTTPNAHKSRRSKAKPQPETGTRQSKLSRLPEPQQLAIKKPKSVIPHKRHQRPRKPQPRRKGRDKGTYKDTNKGTNKVRDKGTNKVRDKSTNKGTDKGTNKGTDKGIDKVTDKVTDKRATRIDQSEQSDLLCPGHAQSKYSALKGLLHKTGNWTKTMQHESVKRRATSSQSQGRLPNPTSATRGRFGEHEPTCTQPKSKPERGVPRPSKPEESEPPSESPSPGPDTEDMLSKMIEQSVFDTIRRPERGGTDSQTRLTPAKPETLEPKTKPFRVTPAQSQIQSQAKKIAASDNSFRTIEELTKALFEDQRLGGRPQERAPTEAPSARTGQGPAKLNPGQDGLGESRKSDIARSEPNSSGVRKNTTPAKVRPRVCPPPDATRLELELAAQNPLDQTLKVGRSRPVTAMKLTSQSKPPTEAAPRGPDMSAVGNKLRQKQAEIFDTFAKLNLDMNWVHRQCRHIDLESTEGVLKFIELQNLLVVKLAAKLRREKNGRFKLEKQFEKIMDNFQKRSRRK